MASISRRLAQEGWKLASGGANGADGAFAKGAPASLRTLWLPWRGYNGHQGDDCMVLSPKQFLTCSALAARLHPNWGRCSQGARKLHARNCAIVMGPDLNCPVKAVLCWTPGGRVQGGTGMGIRIAEENDIPVFNFSTIPAEEIYLEMKKISEANADLSGGEISPESN